VVGIGTGSIGYGRHSNQTRLGQEGFTRLMRHSLDQGVNFFDLADAYGSHAPFQLAMKGVAREKYVIQTKTDSRNAQEVRGDIDRFLHELNTDYIDSLIIHCVTIGDWPTRYRDVMDVFSEAKRQGKIRSCGITCHNFGALQSAAESDWVEINQVRWNPRASHMDSVSPPAADYRRSERRRDLQIVSVMAYRPTTLPRPAATQRLYPFSQSRVRATARRRK